MAYLKPPLRGRNAAPLCADSSRTRGVAAQLRWTLAPLSVARGLAIPRPAVTPSASTAGLRVELARWRLLASASGVALGVKIGGVLRGVLPRSSALIGTPELWTGGEESPAKLPAPACS